MQYILKYKDVYEKYQERIIPAFSAEEAVKFVERGINNGEFPIGFFASGGFNPRTAKLVAEIEIWKPQQ